MEYATKQSFGGQRASVARDVVVKIVGRIFAGKIVAISPSDTPVIRVCEINAGETRRIDPATDTYVFHACPTEKDFEEAPDGIWTWPPRV